MTRFWRLAALFLLLMLCGRSSADEAVLRRLIQSAAADKYPGAAQVVLFDSTQVQVMESGLSYVTIHRLVRVLKPSAAVELACLRFDYDPLSAYVDVQLVKIFRQGGEVEQLPSAAVVDVTAPARAIYWGARQKMVDVGRLLPGDALETIVFRKGFTYALLQEGGNSGMAVQSEADDEKYVPPMRGHFYDIVPFWSAVPMMVKSYCVVMPADKPLQFQFYNGEATSWIHFRKDQEIYYWEKRDINPWKGEPGSVAPTDVAPELLVSTSPDWYVKSLWFNKVNEDYGSFEYTPEIKAKVDELTAACKTDEEKVSVLTHWVAEEVRYSGLTMGPGEGYTLHKGSMTFLDRCGVCKDKAGMLVTMLRAAGFQSYPAMTMAGSRIDRIPADQFNHSVTVWKKKDGSYVLLDPTWVPGVRELWSSAEQQQEYLMGVPEGADLMTTPLSPPEKHYFNISGESELYTDGTVAGQFILEAEGQSDSGVRRGFLRWPRPMWEAFVQQAMYNLSPNAEITRLNYTNPYDLSQPVHVEVFYRIPHYARRVGKSLILTPVVASHPFSDPGTNGHLYMNLDAAERAFPFPTRCSKLIRLKETLKLPAGYKLEHAPQFKSEVGDAADFSAAYRCEGNHIYFDQTLSLKKRIYSAAEWPNFRTAVSRAKKVMQESLVLVQR